MAHSRSVLITGGTVALGFACALEIAQKHPNYLIVVASRTDPDGSAEAINQNVYRPGAAIYLPLDLSNLSRVRQFAQDWETKALPPIQALLLNAGLNLPTGLHKTADGIESTFGVNHVGHALLFHLLTPYLASDARVVLTSSSAHDPEQKTPMADATYISANELAHPIDAKIPGSRRYSTSKLCNVLWGYALDHRLRKQGSNIAVNSFDPGTMPGTGLAREFNGVVKFVWNHILPHVMPLLKLASPNIHTTAESGAALARLATAEELGGVSGKYYEGLKEIKSSKASYDEAKQDDLWQWTVGFVSQGNEAEARRFDELR